MIKGKAKLEFGDGTIQMVPAFRVDGVGAMCFNSVNPHEIGGRESLTLEWSPNDSEVIMTFTNHKSVLTLIEELSGIYHYLLEYALKGEKALPDEHWGRKMELDFDKFMIPKPEPEFLKKNFVIPDTRE